MSQRKTPEYKTPDIDKISGNDVISYFISENILTVTVDNIQKIEIYDITGRLICENSGKNTINVENLQKGVFIIKVYTEEMQVVISKFIKQ